MSTSTPASLSALRPAPMSTRSTMLRPPASPHSFRSIVMPREHGSWSLALEPVALGLLVAPTLAGAFLAVATIAGFFTRRPLKLAWTLPARESRRGAAACWTMFFAMPALAAIFAAGALPFPGAPALEAASGILRNTQASSFTALWPLLLAAPFGAAFLWFDLRNEMREAEAELAGSAAFAFVPAAFATLAGWSTGAALGLAALMLARSVPTVLTVRCFIRLNKRQATSPAAAIAGAAAASAIIALFAARGLVPPLAALLPAVLLVRTVIFVTSLRPAWSAKQVGMLEGAIGLAYLIAATAIFQFA